MGNITKLTPERQDTICKAIRLGATYLLAAQAAGITYATLWAWMDKGKNGVAQIYVDFLDAVKKEEALHSQECLENIRSAGFHHQQWTAAAWLLERRYPREYGKEAELILRSERIEAKLDKLLGKEPENAEALDTKSFTKII